jgi:hypothetical protein
MNEVEHHRARMLILAWAIGAVLSLPCCNGGDGAPSVPAAADAPPPTVESGRNSRVYWWHLPAADLIP